MKNQFSLNIKSPCQENYNQFTQTPSGGFCGSCEQEVVDFTSMNSEETINFFKNKNNQNTCGRFKESQLNTLNVTPLQKNRLNLLSGISFAFLSFFSLISAQAQQITKQVETKGNISELKASKFQKHITVKGNVADDYSALPGVNVFLQGTNIGTQTNFDGDFEFPEKLKIGDILVFSYVGMDSQKVVIENKDSASTLKLKINMKADSVILMGKVAIKEVYKSKRNK